METQVKIFVKKLENGFATKSTEWDQTGNDIPTIYPTIEQALKAALDEIDPGNKIDIIGVNEKDLVQLLEKVLP